MLTAVILNKVSQSWNSAVAEAVSAREVAFAVYIATV